MYNVINVLMINMIDFSYCFWDKCFGNLFYILDILYNKIMKKIIIWLFVDFFFNIVVVIFIIVWIVWVVLIIFVVFFKNFLIFF